ncbi:MAG: flagellar brake protein [Sarcina sp.]
MGKRSILEVNDRVEVERDDIIYKSKIQGLENGKIFIDIPLHNNDFLILNRGEEIKLLSYGKEAVVYEMSCKVDSRKIDGNMRMYILEKPYKVKKIQRRNYVRVNTTRVIKCIKGDLHFDVLLLDLSGGGMRVKSEKKLKLGEEIIAKVANNDNFNEIEVKGTIVRIEDTMNLKHNVFGIEFTDINEWRREKIIKIVFEIMRKQMELI